MHVLKGDAAFNERRNTSRVWPVMPGAHADALRAVAVWRKRDPAAYQWLVDGHPRLTESEHLARFGAPYANRPRRVA